MDKLTFSTGGFPLSVDRLRAMQECWQTQYNELMKGLLGYTSQDYVVSGCGTLGDADGWIVLQGELLEHRRSGLANGNGQYVYVMEEVVENVTYEDGVARPFRMRRYATSGMYVPGSAIYSADWEDVEDNTGAMRTLAALSQNAAKQSDITAVRSQITALQTQIAALDATISALDTSTDSGLGSISDRIAALQRNLVPKGTIIMTAEELPLTSTVNATAIINIMKRLGFWGYIPCGVYVDGTNIDGHISAWNGYISDLGISGRLTKKTTRKSANGTTVVTNYIDFTQLGSAVEVTIPNLAGRFPLGASDTYALADAKGAATHTLTIDEMPSHSHDFLLEEVFRKDGSISAARGSVSSSNQEWVKWTTKATGGSQPFDIMPPYYPLNFLIKVI